MPFTETDSRGIHHFYRHSVQCPNHNQTHQSCSSLSILWIHSHFLPMDISACSTSPALLCNSACYIQSVLKTDLPWVVYAINTVHPIKSVNTVCSSVLFSFSPEIVEHSYQKYLLFIYPQRLMSCLSNMGIRRK